MAVLSRFLDDSQKEVLAKKYYTARLGKEDESAMEEKHKFQLVLNTFLCEFIDLCWRLRPETLKVYEKTMCRMEKDVASFSAKLDILYKQTHKSPFFAH